MNDDDCICGHGFDEHNEQYGYCESCRCVVYRTMEELTEDSDDPEELDLDHYGDAA